MEERGVGKVLLCGLKEIGEAIGAGPRTVRKMIKENGLPAKKCWDGKWRVDPESLRKWFIEAME